MYNVRKANMGRTVNRYATALMEAAAIQSQANVYVLLDSSERVYVFYITFRRFKGGDFFYCRNLISY